MLPAVGQESHSFTDEYLDGALLFLIAIDTEQLLLFDYLLSEFFAHRWSYRHIRPIEQVLIASRNKLYIEHLLQSVVYKHIFEGFEEDDRYACIDRFVNLAEQGGLQEPIFDSLKHRPYASVFILHLLKRNVFMHLPSEQYYDTITNVYLYDLEQIYKRKENEERLVSFLKYISILSADDWKKGAGERLIERFNKFPQFRELMLKAQVDQDDDETCIQDEAPVNINEVSTITQTKTVGGHRLKGIDVEGLKSAIVSHRNEEIIERLEGLKLSNLFNLRGLFNKESKEHRELKDEDLMGCLVYFNCTKAVEYLLQNYKVANVLKVVKQVD